MNKFLKKLRAIVSSLAVAGMVLSSGQGFQYFTEAHAESRIMEKELELVLSLCDYSGIETKLFDQSSINPSDWKAILVAEEDIKDDEGNIVIHNGDPATDVNGNPIEYYFDTINHNHLDDVNPDGQPGLGDHISFGNLTNSNGGQKYTMYKGKYTIHVIETGSGFCRDKSPLPREFDNPGKEKSLFPYSVTKVRFYTLYYLYNEEYKPELTDNFKFDILSATDGSLVCSIEPHLEEVGLYEKELELDYYVSGLKDGKYILQSTELPENFKPIRQEFTVDSEQYYLNHKIDLYIDLEPVEPDKEVTIDVTKTSTNPKMTDSNSLYSLEGAVYSLYTDSQCATEPVGSVTINAEGKGTSEKITLAPDVTTLYAKETTAPSNGSYELNPEIIEVPIQDNKGSFTATDTPISDPLNITVRKTTPDGDVVANPASLAGAEFTINYYNGDYPTLDDLAGVEPDEQWVLKTEKGADGTYSLNINEEFFLGTLTIQETKAPNGYTTKGGLKYTVNGETKTGATDNGVALFRLYNENGTVTLKSADNAVVDNSSVSKEDEVIRGSLEVTTTDAEVGGVVQGDAKNLSATFTLHNDNDYDAVMRDAEGNVLGTAAAGQDFNYTITTDESGYWKSSDNFLPVGKYTLRETTAPEGYIASDEQYTFTLSAGTTSISVNDIFKNTIMRGGFEFQKNDSVLGAQAQGNAELETKFAVYNISSHAVTVNGVSYPVNAKIFETSTDENGYYKTTANMLPYGTYKLVETEAPEGYTLNGVTETTFSIRNNGEVVNLKEQKISDEVIRGGFKVQKYDSELESGAQGDAGLQISFNVISNSDKPVVVNGVTYNKGDVVLSAATDDSGYYESAADLLPYGDYTLKETAAPTGYHMQGDLEESFTISENGTIVDLTDHKITDTVIRGGFKVQKHDVFTGTRPQGDTNLQMTFDIINSSPNAVIVNGEEYASGETVYTASTDENGYFESTDTLLPYGTYTLRETKAPVGYTSDGVIETVFTVREEGVITDLTDHKIQNRPVLGGVAIHKVLTDVEGTNWTENEEGAIFGIVKNSYVEQYGSVAEAIAHQYGVTTAEVTNRDWLNATLFAEGNTANTVNQDGTNPDLMTGHEYAVIRTDANGDATTGETALAFDDYTVAQLASGDDEITVTDQKYNVTISEDGTVIQLQASNIPQTYFIRMVKKDADTGKLSTFNSAEFKIYQLEDVRGEEVNEYVTMKVGSVTYDTFRTASANGAEDLPSGTFYAAGESAGSVTTPLKLESGLYRIEEVGTPDGFITTDAVEQVVRLSNISETDEEGNHFITVTISDPRAYGELVINDVIAETAADADLIPADILSKIEFTLTADEDIINPDDGTVLTKKGEVAKDILGNTVGKFNLNAEGKATVSKIAFGSYTLTQTYIPDELAVNTETWDVDFVQAEDDVTTQVYNVTLDIENKPTVVALSKKDVSGEGELAGASMQIVDGETDTVVAEYTTGEKVYTVKGLKRDNVYLMREIAAPNNGEYVKAKDVNFEVNDDGSSKTVTMIDKLVTLNKTDVNDSLVAGAEITITDAKGETVDVITTDGENTFHIHNLTAGETYKVSETVVPDGYVKFNDFTFTVADDGKDQTLDIVNKIVSVSKVDAEGNPVSGADMIVITEDGAPVDNWTTDGTAHNVSGLEEGREYILRESSAPEGYVKANDITFTAEGADENGVKADQSIEMTDKKVTVTKKDVDGNFVTGAEITLTDRYGNVADKWTTGEEGYNPSNLVAGETYTVSETVVPAGYVKFNDFTFTVADDGKDQTLDLVNKIVSISKVDDEGNPVTGAEMAILDGEGNTVDSWTTDGTDHNASGLAEDGEYVLREVKAAEGYVRANDIAFTADGADEENIKANQTVVMTDKQLVLNITDSEGNPVEGVGVALIDKDGVTVDTWTSDETGKYAASNLIVGETYTVSETATPAGYVKFNDFTFTVTDDGKDQTVTIVNNVETVAKVDQDGEFLAGASLEVVDSEGTVIDSWISGEEEHNVSGLVEGNEYTVREVDEVNGYYFAENQTINTTEKEDHTTTMIDNIINYRINKVDEDGNNIAGVLMSMKDITDPENPVDIELPNDGVTTEVGFDLSGVLIAGHRYEITEERTVDGFSMPQVSTMEFVVPTHGSAEWTVLNFENLSNAIAVSKVDNYGKPLAGAHMAIYEVTVAEDGTITEGDMVYEFTTTEAPTDISDYVKGGDGSQYMLREVESPFGYDQIADMLFSVDMAEPGTAQMITAIDSLEHVFIEAEKVDAADHNKKLEGAELTLFTADGEIAKTVDGKDAVAVTDKNGEVSWEVEYAEGMYVQETKAPEGYKLNSNYHEVKIEKDYTFSENDPIEIMVADEADPKTGVTSGIGGMIAMAGMAGALGVLLYSMRKKESEAD